MTSTAAPTTYQASSEGDGGVSRAKSDPAVTAIHTCVRKGSCDHKAICTCGHRVDSHVIYEPALKRAGCRECGICKEEHWR